MSDIKKKNREWMPRSKESVLELSQSWEAYITDGRAAAWGIPASDMADFRAKCAAAAAAQAEATGENRGPVATAAANGAFAALKVVMRRLKNRYLLPDPLSGDDFVALGLAVPGRRRRVRVPAPVDAPVFSMSHGVFMVVIVKHDAKERGISGAVMKFVILPAGAPAPSYEQLTDSRLLTKRVERLCFGDSLKGMVLYASLFWLTTSGKKGPPSDIQSIVLG